MISSSIVHQAEHSTERAACLPGQKLNRAGID
jgi:hypothetical protein